MRAALIGAVLLATASSSAADAGCQVSVAGVSFGSLSPSTRTDSTGKVRVDCDIAAGFEIAIAPGSDGGQRRMQGPNGATLRYDLYVDAGRRTVWGDGQGGGITQGGVSDGMKARTFVIYGAVPSQPTAPPGEYLDAPLVTLRF